MASRTELATGRVLVTGLGGFTGPYLQSALELAGHEVIAAGDLSVFDVCAPDSVSAVLRKARPDYVIHLAGISFVPHGDPAGIYAVNAVGSINLLEAIGREVPHVRKVILASSANVYGNAQCDPIDEDTALQPVNHYGCSKLSMEHLARTWFDRLPIVIVRPFNYTGRGQAEHFLVPKLVTHFSQRAPVIQLGNLDVVRDFSDVRMVCDAYTRLMTSPVHATAFNVCSGNGRSLHWILDELERYCGHRPKLLSDPALIRPVEVHRLIGSNLKLRESIGELRYVDFSATLQWMCDYAKGPRKD